MSLTQKDLFEILHHEDHQLEIVKYGSNHILGCKQCGVDLVSVLDLVRRTSSYESLLNTLVERDSDLYEKVMQLGRIFLCLEKKDITEISKIIIEKVKENKGKQYLSPYERAYCIFNLKNEIQSYVKDKYDVSYSQVVEMIYGKSNKPYIEAVKKISECLKEMSDSFNIYTNNEKVISGCKVFKIEHSDTDTSIMVVDKDILVELEESMPTPTDIYKFEDINDYYDKLPEYEDEENNNNKYIEFIYRVENDLYDFSNLDMKDVYSEIISVIDGYEYMDRYITLLRKLLLNK